MKKPVFALSLALIAALTASCSAVKVSEAGKRVNILTANEVFNCTKLGSVSTSVMDNVLFIPRNKETVQSDLDKLARDQAVIMRANTLVRTQTRDGFGDYMAYNCP
jgi:hypothetical protein